MPFREDRNMDPRYWEADPKKTAEDRAREDHDVDADYGEEDDETIETETPPLCTED